ncbi:MFS transporter [Penicillium waksmanii]|uniref:MFS transporter n=1 Tax=Penicillium waksmanii TaxID=69791 RepID=UPI00254855E7|nr:MFS transporter [Penicillium waksmanii]KAJ5988142.1 MFS transporter [Penicillium waksmanii]
MSTSELQAGNVRRSEPQPSIAPTPSGHLSSKAPVKEIREELPAPPNPVYTALSLSRRRFILGIITVAGIFGPLAGNIYLPALPVVGRQFHRTEAEINITVTVFMIVFAFGNSSQPLIWSSFADWKGRRPLYIVSILVYILANVLLAAVPANYGALIVLRVVQAFGSSAVVSLGAGTVADLIQQSRVLRYGFSSCLRSLKLYVHVWGMGVYTPTRAGFSFLPPKFSSPIVSESERGPPPPKPTLKGYWKLFQYPPIGITCMNTAILYSSYFCIAIQLPSALGDVYHWSSSEVGAGYVVVGVAMVIGSISGGHFSDWRRKRSVQALGESNVHPEARLNDQIWGLLLASAGLIMFGFFVEHALHPAATLISTFLVGFGMSWMFVASNAFLTLCLAQQAAGAFALGNMLRSPAAAVAAAIIAPLVQKMGWGYCFLGLGILNLVGIGSMLIVLRTQSARWAKARLSKGMQSGHQNRPPKSQ